MSTISFDSFLEEEFTNFEILEMDIKGKLLTIINKKIMENSWNQTQTAEQLGITQPRVSNLKNLYHDKFSIEMLLKFADMLGCSINVETESGLQLNVKE